MIGDSRYLYIERRNSGQTPIRPHNWAERFAGNPATYSADRRLRYSSALEPLSINGKKWLRICRTLQDSNPALVHDMFACTTACASTGWYGIPEWPGCKRVAIRSPRPPDGGAT